MIRAMSLFSQLVHQVPRDVFAKLVGKHGAERAAKGFASWTQFVAMLFCQVGRAESLRDICNGLACAEGKLVRVRKIICRFHPGEEYRAGWRGRQGSCYRRT